MVALTGAVVQVPTPLTDKRRLSLAMKWIITAARKRKSRLMPQALAAELVDASNNQVRGGSEWIAAGVTRTAVADGILGLCHPQAD